MKTIAILHTARATVPMLTEMIGRQYPGVMIYNWLDDSILPMLAENIDNMEFVFEKMLYYAKMAEKQGADVIFNACSSVGAFQDYAKGKLQIPVVRIDDEVTDILVQNYKAVGVLATLETTMKPSADLIRRKNPDISLSVQVAAGAWEAGLSGNKEKMKQLIADAAMELFKEKEAVFLAQASMAEAAELLPEEYRSRIYTSPEYGVASLKRYLQ